VLERQLANADIRTGSCASVDEALAVMQQACTDGDRYQIAIIDQQMPVADGEALVRAVKEDTLLRDTELIMLTSVGERGDASRLEAVGLAAYLVKPTPESQILACLTAVWGAHTLGDKRSLVTRHTLDELKAAKEPRSVPPRATFNVRLLLVDDDSVNQEVGRWMLEKSGCRVDTACDGREAVDMLLGAHYDLVFMDCQMPIMDGFEATGEIRRREGASHPTPIVALTANAMKGDREKCLDAGMDDYVSKPVTPEAFHEMLHKYCGGKQAAPAAASTDSNSVNTTEKQGDGQAAESYATDESDAHGGVPNSEVRQQPEDSSPLRVSEALDRVGGDEDILRTITRIFLDSCPSMLAQVEKAVSSGDAEGLEQFAHRLKGSVANFGAARACLLYTSPSPRDVEESRMPSSA